MIRFELTRDDATFLSDNLAIRAREIENELVHTDTRSMQKDLASDLKRIERLRGEIANVISSSDNG